jgi:hypothetical protein
MQRLFDIGFKYTGEWILKNDILDYDLIDHSQEKNLLYSFVIGKRIYYLGKTTYTLKKRMNGYKNSGSSQKTNLRVKDEIIKKLESGKNVYIYILLNDAKFKYKNYPVCLASGLKDLLIIELDPVWNVRGKAKNKH